MIKCLCGGAFVAVICFSQTVLAQATDPPWIVTWDGTTSNNWTEGNWTYDDLVNPVQTGATAYVASREWGSKGGRDITIGGGAQVVYDWYNFIDVDGDYRTFHTRVRNGPGGLTITDGASLSIIVDGRIDTLAGSSADGMASEFDAQFLNLDNGTLIRGFDPNASGTDPLTGNPILPGTSGGPLAFGTSQGDDPRNTSGEEQGAQWASESEINLTHGGQIINNGQMWFGYWSAPIVDRKTYDRTITMTINDGTVDLTGGNVNTPKEDPNDDFANADLIFTNYEDLNHTYRINFTGPGSITVDNGIINAHLVSGSGTGPFGSYLPSDWIDLNLVEYEDLWDAGILQAHGLSGLDGETFSDYFTVTGVYNGADYTLTSKVLAGDYALSGNVNGFDFLKWQRGESQDPLSAADFAYWEANFGTSAGPLSGAIAAVPEPSTGVLLVMAASMFFGFRRRSNGR